MDEHLRRDVEVSEGEFLGLDVLTEIILVEEAMAEERATGRSNEFTYDWGERGLRRFGLLKKVMTLRNRRELAVPQLREAMMGLGLLNEHYCTGREQADGEHEKN